MEQLYLFDDDWHLHVPIPRRRRTQNERWFDEQLKIAEDRQVLLFANSLTCVTCGKVEVYRGTYTGAWIMIEDRAMVVKRACSVACLPVDTGRKSHTREPTRVAFVSHDPDGLMEIF